MPNILDAVDEWLTLLPCERRPVDPKCGRCVEETVGVAVADELADERDVQDEMEGPDGPP